MQKSSYLKRVSIVNNTLDDFFLLQKCFLFFSYIKSISRNVYYKEYSLPKFLARDFDLQAKSCFGFVTKPIPKKRIKTHF